VCVCVCVCIHIRRACGALTVLEDADEQRLVPLALPPVGRDLGVERLRDPDVQLTVTQNIPFVFNNNDRSYGLVLPRGSNVILSFAFKL